MHMFRNKGIIMEEILFYCQSCDATITADLLAMLNEGKCPSCGSIEGYSTVSKKDNDGFDSLTVVNDTEMLEKVFNS